MNGWLAGLVGDFGYRPRHRSTRQALVGAGRLPQSEWDHPASLVDDRPDWPDTATDASWLAGPAGQPDLLDQLTSDEIRRLAEGFALGYSTRNVPDLVQAIGHSSHTAATLTSAWREFRESIRDMYALRLRSRNWTGFYWREDEGSHSDAAALEQKARQADDAWWLITNGLPLRATARRGPAR
jgi:hypothetical protein